MINLSERLFARTEPLDIQRSVRVAVILCAVVFIGALWAAWAELEEQIKAPGTVIVSSRSQVVQVVDGGVLQNLLVREGDSVKAGDLIAELYTVRFQANSEEMAAKVFNLKASLKRLEAEINGTPLSFPEDIAKKPDIVAAQMNLFARRQQLQREEQDAIEKSIKLAQEELASLVELEKTGDASRTEVIRARRQVNDLRATATNKRNAYRQDAQTELARSRAELEQAEQVLTQRNEALDATRIRAPMTGTIKNVRITTLGAVLKPGDELLQIVPSDDPLIIEVKVRSADVAFVRKDLHANVNLDAYDSAIYGSLKGHVTYISPDTLMDEQRRDEQPYYRVHIQIDEMPETRGKSMEVLPGMTVNAQIITGKRTVAQYLLKPLRRISSDALTER